MPKPLPRWTVPIDGGSPPAEIEIRDRVVTPAGRDLPIHPAYACSLDGTIDRAVLRVSTIGGERGRRFGRQQWERRYYPEVVAQLRKIGKAAP